MMPLIIQSLELSIVAKDGDWSIGIFDYFELIGFNLAAKEVEAIAAPDIAYPTVGL